MSLAMSLRSGNPVISPIHFDQATPGAKLHGMDPESPNTDGDGGIDPEKLEALRPLSFFFPEVTSEEARTLDAETLRIMERRVRIMDLYRRRKPMKEIAAEVKCSLGTVHHDIHTVLAGYKRIAARTAQEHIADALQRLADREADIETEWEKSKVERVELFEDERASGSTMKLKTKQGYGDPRLAALLLQCWDRRCKLLGMLTAADLGGKDGLPPVKLVAGMDPMEGA
jgi:hypothetical protein